MPKKANLLLNSSSSTAIASTGILVVNDKGGSTKDIVAEGIYLAAQHANLKPILIEIESKQRLKKNYPETEYFRSQLFNPEEQYRNPDIVYSVFDKSMARVRDAGFSITCIGANITQGLQVWSETSGAAYFGEGEMLTIVTALTFEPASLFDGLTNTHELGRLYPKARRVAVLNDHLGDFLEDDPVIAKLVREAQGDGLPIEIIRIKRFAAPHWGHMKFFGGLAQIANHTYADLVAKGLDEGAARRSFDNFDKWLWRDLISPLAALLPARSGESS